MSRPLEEDIGKPVRTAVIKLIANYRTFLTEFQTVLSENEEHTSNSVLEHQPLKFFGGARPHTALVARDGLPDSRSSRYSSTVKIYT